MASASTGTEAAVRAGTARRVASEEPTIAGRGPRVALYFAVFFPTFLVVDLLMRTWGTGLGLAGPDRRRARMNGLIRGWGDFITWWTTLALGVRIEVRGEIPPGRFVVVSNHQSLADIPFLIRALWPLHCKFVAKRELSRRVPTISQAIARGGMVAVARNVGMRDVRALDAFGGQLEAWNGSAIVFAEGGRSTNGSLDAYSVSAVRLVSGAAGLPLLPVCIDGTHRATRLGDIAARMPGARVLITIGPPIARPAGDEECRQAVQDLRNWTLRVLEEGRLEGAVSLPDGWTAAATGTRCTG